MRALTSLKNAGIAVQGAEGKAPEMSLHKIQKDPSNLRPAFELRTPAEQQQQRELDANVKKRGVKSPISLRPHPIIPETWIINHGHCRYDAAVAASLDTIPYFVDPNFDSYDQIAENLHRCDLSVWAIAEFIKRKLEEGESKGQIAEGLGKETQNYVTDHLALVDAPNCLHLAYSKGVKSARTLYDLRRAYDEFPEQVDAWCDGETRITRDLIKELQDKLRHEVSELGAANDDVVLPAVGEDTADVIRDGPGLSSTAESVSSEVTEANRPTPEPAGEPEKGVTSRGDAPSLRHDVKTSKHPAAQSHVVGGGNQFTGRALVVKHRGRIARLPANTMVTITIDGADAPTKVPISELDFGSGR
jgi:ParB family chromosome partitioning protein